MPALQNKKFWDMYYRFYDVLLTFVPYQSLLQELKKSLKLQSQDIVLDAGGGSGNFAAKIVEDVKKVIVLDFSEFALDVCRKKNSKIICLMHDLVKPLPLKNNSVNKICCNNVIYTMPRSKRLKIIKEFYRVLKKNGLLVVSNPRKGADFLRVFYNNFQIISGRNGFIFGLWKTVVVLPKIIALGYFNMIIRRAENNNNIDYLDFNDQEALLREAQFKIIKSSAVYSDQAILTVGKK